MKNFENLNFSDNGTTGIPAEIGNLKNLKELDQRRKKSTKIT